MRRRILIIAVLLTTFACAGFGIRARRNSQPTPTRAWTPPPIGTYSAQIAQLESANIDADVDAALSKGDRRLVGVMGDGPVIPGIPDPLNYMQYEKEFGFRFIPNTSDVIESAEQSHLQTAGYNYAKQYNTLLLVRLKGSPESSASSRP